MKCNLCENIKKCELIDDSLELNNLTMFINNQRPIKISNKLLDRNLFDLKLEQLMDFYSKLTNEDKVCMFESNLNFDNAFDLISKLNDQRLPIYAHWENCGYSLRKKLRSIYEIPDFMPMMLEFTRENWFLISLNRYKSDNFKKVSTF